MAIPSIKLGKQIGKGGFGKVYKAKDPVHGTVAAKIFRRRRREGNVKWRRRSKQLLNEGRRLKDSEHDNVVKVFDVKEKNNEIWLVMEFCKGGSLQNYYEKGPMCFSMLRDVFTEVALGLHAIHNRGMIHRDIKPANILIDENNHAKIGDFGLVTDDIFDGYASAAGYIDHVAKEVFITRETSIKSDIWAFGMTVYRMLNGKDFYEDTVPEPRKYVHQGGFTKKLSWLPHIPKRWRSFVRSTMNDDTQKRIQDCQELLSKLAKLPVAHDWGCDYDPNSICWERSSGNRVIKVKYNAVSPRKYQWQAKSHPIGEGRIRKLASSDGVVSKTAAIKTLEEYFLSK